MTVFRCFIVVLAFACAFGAAGSSAPAPGAAEAVGASLEVERILLKEDLETWSRLAARRVEIAEKARAFYESADAALDAESSSSASPASLADMSERLAELDRERQALASEERQVLDRMRERRHRIVLLEGQVASLTARAEEAAGPLSGTWDVSILPVQQRGRFTLTQSGTIVTGTYQLDGGFSGSLQGTFVGRKIVLERIDSKLGRWGRYEGFLSPDGARLRGSWFSLELAGQAGGEGQWSAVRAPASP